jgi:hypothetical protein
MCCLPFIQLFTADPEFELRLQLYVFHILGNYHFDRARIGQLDVCSGNGVPIYTHAAAAWATRMAFQRDQAECLQ